MVYMTDEALSELETTCLWLAEQSPRRVPEWFDRTMETIDSLENNPEQHPFAPEEVDHGKNIRHFVIDGRPYGYRILFMIRGQSVYMVHGKYAMSGAAFEHDREGE